MRHELTEWIETIRDGTEPFAGEALLRLALLLESTRDPGRTPSAANRQLYDDVLGAPQDRPKILPADHVEIAGRLSAIWANSPLESSLLWAIGKANPGAGIPVLLGILEARGGQLATESAYQLCIALQDLIEPHPRAAPIHVGPKASAALLAFARSADARLEEAAGVVLCMLARPEKGGPQGELRK